MIEDILPILCVMRFNFHVEFMQGSVRIEVPMENRNLADLAQLQEEIKDLQGVAAALFDNSVVILVSERSDASKV